MQAMWADSYEPWMTAELGTIGGSAWPRVSGLMSDMEAGGTADQLTSLDNLESSPLWGQGTFLFEFELSWPGGAVVLKSLDKW